MIDKIDLLQFYPKSSDDASEVFLKKIRNDLNNLKMSSISTKTTYFRAFSGSEGQKRYNFLILDGSRRALKIEFYS